LLLAAAASPHPHLPTYLPLLPVCAAAAGPAVRSPPPSTLCMALPTCWLESSSCSSCPRLAIKAVQPPRRPTSLRACLLAMLPFLASSACSVVSAATAVTVYAIVAHAFCCALAYI
jgi:hypothetical protein